MKQLMAQSDPMRHYKCDILEPQWYHSYQHRHLYHQVCRLPTLLFVLASFLNLAPKPSLVIWLLLTLGNSLILRTIGC
jgi:hypothetical protein